LNAFTVAINKMGALSNAEYLWMYEQDPPCSEEAIAALKFAVKVTCIPTVTSGLAHRIIASSSGKSQIVHLLATSDSRLWIRLGEVGPSRETA